MDFERLETEMRRLAIEAGARIMEVYNRPDFDVRAKSDDSPVTEADEAADRHIAEGLGTSFPETLIVTEEQAGTHQAHDASFLIVDPLDGTKEFVQRRGEFTVNIALIEKSVPVLGVVVLLFAFGPLDVVGLVDDYVDAGASEDRERAREAISGTLMLPG